jgi:hypothetical protein
MPQEALQQAYAWAMVGKRDAALALADQAVAMSPLTKHAIDGARYAGANEFFTSPGRLIILALLDERDRFFAELETLINVPAAVDPRYLAMDPTFDALRTDPRFERISDGAGPIRLTTPDRPASAAPRLPSRLPQMETMLGGFVKSSALSENRRTAIHP